MINVVVADDHNLVRQGICALLEGEDDLCVVGEARDGIEAVSLAESMKPNVLVLDINMPRQDGIETLKEIKRLGLGIQVIILSMYSDESLIKKALKNGARGYLLKRSVTEDLLTAIRATNRDEIFISPEITNNVDIDWIITQPEDDDPLGHLTPRERQIFKLVAEGYTNYAIANELGISVKTVEKHRSNLMEKLGVSDVTGLVREAILHGLIFLED
jgi:DNA-binding NarL/FixJ family response regulator